MKVTKEMTVDAAHRLYGYEGDCGNLHGHTYKIQCTWEANGPGRDGFIKDFVECKKDMQRLKEMWDHAVILNSDDPLYMKLFGETGKVFSFQHINPTVENMCAQALDIVGCSEVTIWETPTSFCTL